MFELFLSGLLCARQVRREQVSDGNLTAEQQRHEHLEPRRVHTHRHSVLTFKRSSIS
jgi:hypothetical protein